MILKKGNFYKIFIAAFYIIGVFLIISIFASHFKPASFSFFAIIALFFPLLWIIEALLLIVFIFKRNYKLLIISVVLLLLGSNQVLLNINFSDNNTPKLDNNGIKLISFNTGNADTINPFIKRKEMFKKPFFQKSDIICLQEFTPTNEKDIGVLIDFRNKINVDYYGITESDSSGLSVYTNYEIINFGWLKQDMEDTYALWCNINCNGDTIKLINIQLQSIRLEDEELESMTEISQMGKLPGNILSIFSKLKRGFEWREEQVEKLNELITESKFPVILCGDFNDPPSSFTYRELSGLLRDAFVEKGNGFGFTYAGNLPFLRIDYVMVSDEINVLTYKKMNETHSDHYPIEVKVSTYAKASADKETEVH